MYLPSGNTTAVLRLDFVLQPIGIMALCFGKLSVAFLMLRFIGPNTKWQKWVLYAIIVVSLIFSVVTSAITFAQCDPPKALWEKVPGSKCWDPRIQTNLSVFLGCKCPLPLNIKHSADREAGWNAFIDFTLALLPISIVWNLKLKANKKIGLCVLLGLGVLYGILLLSSISPSRLMILIGQA